MPFLRQSTSQVIRFGPCLDITDGVTEETGLTLAQADMRLSKDGGAFAQKNASGNATHDSDGWYSTTLDATDTATVGELILNVHQPANMLPVWYRYWVLEEAVYDDMFGASAAGYLQPTTAGRTLDVTATGAAGIDWANVENPTTALDLSATDIQLCDTVTTNTDVRGTDSALLAASAPTNFGDLSITATTGLVSLASTGLDAIVSTATGMVEIAKAVWDRVLTGGTHNITNSAGRRIRELVDATVLREDTFQAGSTTTTLVLDASASSVDNFYRFQNVIVEDGVAGGQVRIISAYDGTTKVADISEPLVTAAPASGDTFQITTMGPVHSATQGGVYEGGKIYIDTVGGTSGTVPFVNGTITRPVDNIADARALGDELNITRYHCTTGSVIVFTQEFAGTTWTGAGYALILNGQDISGIRVNNGFVTGVNTGTSLKLFRQCSASDITGDNMSFIESVLLGTITASGTGDLGFSNCFSVVDLEPTIDFSTAGNQGIEFNGHNGPLIISNLGNTGTDVFSFHGTSSSIVFDSSCTGGSAVLAGTLSYTNNGSGITINDDAVLNIPAINAEVDTALSDYDGPTKAEMDTAHGLLATEAKQDVIDTNVDAILVDTGTDGVVVSAAGFTDIWATTALTEAYATDGSDATPAQMLYMIWSALGEFSITGTTITAKKLDGSTTAMTFTLDDGTNPTSRTRAT